MVANGYLQTSLLREVDGKLFAAAAAPYFAAMFDAMEADGVGRPHVRWGYRDYNQQVAMREEYGTGAAWPGTSNHGLGISADLASGPAPHWFALTRAQLAWLRSNAARFGIVEDVEDESWHWTFKITPTIDPEDDMFTPDDRKLLQEIRSDLGKIKTPIDQTNRRTVSVQKLLGTMATRLAAIAGKLGLK